MDSELIEDLNGLSEHTEVQLTATLKDGIWETHLILTPHPLFFKFHPDCPHNTMLVCRGVGTSFIEAFNNLSGCDDEGSGNGFLPDIGNDNDEI